VIEVYEKRRRSAGKPSQHIDDLVLSARRRAD
jgi:hypothetical protein